jgi:hypothetical protein
VAGIIAGAVMSAIMLGVTAASGGDIWQAMKGAGTPFLGERAHQPGFDGTAVAVGVGSHFLVSIGWGMLFGAICYGLSRGATVVMGLFWGLVVWLGMYYVVLPLVGMGAMPKQVPIVRAILTHLLFGLALGLAFAPFQRRVLRPTRPWLDRTDMVDRTGRPVY